MGSNITFGKWEASCLMISLMGTKVILSYPNRIAEIAGSAAWIMAIYSTVLVLIAVNLRQFSEEIKVISFPITPISIVVLFFMAGILFASYRGIEAIVRFQGIFVAISILGFLSYLVMLIPYFRIDNITPYLGTGPYKIFVKGFLRVSDFSELIVLFMIYPFIKTKKNFKKIGLFSIAASGFFMASLTLVFLGIFPYPVATEFYLPAFQMGRLVYYGRFFQRVESLFLTTWNHCV